MENKLTFNNYVMIRLDAENTSIKLKNGFELYIDTTFEPEKHSTVTGTVVGLPSKLRYTGKGNNGMPWLCDMELKFGDKVIIYYLSIINALSKDSRRYVLEGEDKYVWVPYSSIYCKYGGGWITPINGYCLIEPCEDPFVTAQKERYAKLGIELITLNARANTAVCFGKVKYMGVPNKEYCDEGQTDEGVGVKEGDTVVLKRVSDVPLMYDLHAKIEQGKKLWRIQRRSILARI